MTDGRWSSSSFPQGPQREHEIFRVRGNDGKPHISVLFSPFNAQSVKPGRN